MSLDFCNEGVVLIDANTNTVTDVVGDPSTKASLKHLSSIKVLSDDAKTPSTLSEDSIIEMGKVTPININKNGFDKGIATGG